MALGIDTVIPMHAATRHHLTQTRISGIMAPFREFQRRYSEFLRCSSVSGSKPTKTGRSENHPTALSSVALAPPFPSRKQLRQFSAAWDHFAADEANLTAFLKAKR